jgi:hypothetical protein
VTQIVQHLDPGELPSFECLDLLIGPDRLFRIRQVDGRPAGRRLVADRRRALLCDELAALVAIEVIAALKAGRPGELGVLHDVVEGDPLVGE